MTRKITLGFTPQFFDAGVHICQIYSSDEERGSSLVDYIVSGITTQEKVACFSKHLDIEQLSASLEKHAISPSEMEHQGKLTVQNPGEVYFKGEGFCAERMLGLLADFYDQAQSEDYLASRVIGEMLSEIEDVEGVEKLLEYEARVGLLLQEKPITAVCQYDARKFRGSTIMDVLKVHPYMVVRGSVVSNPFYLRPEDFLASCT